MAIIWIIAVIALERTAALKITSDDNAQLTTPITFSADVILNHLSNYSSSLTPDHWTFQRSGGYSFDYYYDALLIKTVVYGNYTIQSESDIDLDGFLYSPAFLETSPSSDLIASDQQYSRDGDFLLISSLEPTRRYFIVVTTHRPSVFGEFKLIVTGPATVEFIPIKMSPPVNTTYESAWTGADLTFQHPQTHYGEYYYDVFLINITTEGIYTLMSESALVNYGLLYSPSFDAAMPWKNLIASDYDQDWDGTFLIRFDLKPHILYYLVVTTDLPMKKGTFKLIITGPATVNIIPIMPGPFVRTSYQSSWTTDSPSMSRPNGSDEDYYFDLFHVITPITGIYTLRSRTPVDSVVFLYYPSFDLIWPSGNLVASGDPTGFNVSFQIQYLLEANHSYYLVISSFWPGSTTTFTVTVIGPDLVNLTRIPIQPLISTTYQSMWTTRNPTFQRPYSFSLNASYYHLIQLTSNVTGNYSFRSESSLGTSAYLYSSTFDERCPMLNLIAFDDGQSNDQRQFRMTQPIVAHQQYYLVVTTYFPDVVGKFSVFIRGRTSVDLIPITVGGYINVTYESQLTTTNPIFQSLYGTSGDYYYEVIGVSVEKTSQVILHSQSSIDTYGYLYYPSFDPIAPYKNIYAYNDQSAGNGQFQISRNLIAGEQYYLVVSTKFPETTGRFNITANGLSSVNLTSIPQQLAYVAMNYTFSWTINNATFELSPISESLSYFALITIVPNTSGIYTFQSLGDVMINGYLYSPTFNTSLPLLNLKKYNLQSHVNGGFRLSYPLQVNYWYYLLATTYFSDFPDPFSLVIRGPAAVGAFETKTNK